jgi:predicted metalloprotease
MERASGGGRGAGGGGLPIPMGKGGGIIGVIVVIAVLILGGRSVTGGGDGGGGFGLPDVLNGLPAAAPAEGDPLPSAPTEDEQFAGFVLDDVQATWADLFSQAGKQYTPAVMTTFQGGVQTACGGASSSVGPFYCPADSKVYLDFDFWQELDQRFGASGDFARAYVIAHEVGHHVQNQLGIDDQVRQAAQQDPDATNELSVRQELQADCFAGVWGHSTYQRGILEDGDLEEGLNAAAAVGDDRLTQGRVSPDSFTHGTSEQRTKWFKRGFDSGNPEDCDTFSGGL